MSEFRGQSGWVANLIVRMEQALAQLAKLRDDGGRLRGTPDNVVGVFPSDASVVTYTPADDTDWTGSADPGNVDGALDQLAARVGAVETTHYSYAMYVFMPDADPGATIASGDQQGPVLHSGPAAEIADLLYVDAETAPGASGLPVTIEYGDTNDLDTVSTWTTIVTYTLSSEKSNTESTMSNATVPADRLLRMNIGTIVGTPKDATITLRTKRPLAT